jgi:hypothetical protein
MLDTTRLFEDIANRCVELDQPLRYLVPADTMSSVLFIWGCLGEGEDHRPVPYIIVWRSPAGTELLYLEAEEGLWFWRSSEKAMCSVSRAGSEVTFSARAYSQGFALSAVAPFPLNKDGVYSDTIRSLEISGYVRVGTFAESQMLQ